MGIGPMEAALLNALSSLETPGLDLATARRLFSDWPEDAVHAAFRRLVDKGRIRRLVRGKYYPVTEDPTRAACHAYAPAYVSFLTRLHDEGYTEQIPRRLDLAYARARTRTADWGGLPIMWHPVPPAAFRGYDARRDGVLEATAAKAAADLVHRQKAFGGLEPHRQTVSRALADASEADLVEAIRSYSAAPGTLRRLIHLTTAVRTLPPSLSDSIADLDTHNPIPLDLTRRQGQPMGPMNVISTEADA